MTVALCSGYIIVYYGELVFWATPEREGFLRSERPCLLKLLLCHARLWCSPLAHWLYNRVGLTEFKPSKVELWILGVLVLLYYAFITVPAAPKALWVLPPLMGVTFWALSKNRRAETRPDAIVAFSEKGTPLNYLLLFLIPLVAIAIYFLALANNARVPTNHIIYVITTPLGALLWLMGVVMCFRPNRVRNLTA